MEAEQWKPVVGYEGLYEVSDMGRVRGVDRIDSAGRHRPGVVLHQARKPNGRMQVRLSRHGRGGSVLVHRLVARAFHGQPAPGMEVRHLDGDTANNQAANLRWGTSSENKLDAVRHGTHVETRKTSCPRGHALAAPNLVSSHVKRRQRECLACARARRAAVRAGVPLTKDIADEKYAQIMRGN